MSENRPQMTVQSAVEVVAAVVDVEQGEKVLRIYREEQAPVDFVCMAHGTARTEMLDLLGIGETAKAIVMCMVSRQTGVRLLKRLGRELEMRYPGRARPVHAAVRSFQRAVLRKMRLNDFSVSKFRPKRKSCSSWCEAMRNSRL